MKKLVIDHSYALGIAWDKTHFRNHGVVHKAVAGTGFFNHSLSFVKGRGGPGSLVVVPPSESLSRMGALRVKAQIYFAPQGTPRRHNVVEGHLSFALFIDPDFSLVGSVLAPGGRWIAVKTPPNAVTPQTWTVVEFWYDGVSRSQLLVNGQALPMLSYSPVLIARPIPGEVRGIGPLGVFVGHWADLDDRYTFDGYISRMQLYKRDDYDLLQLLDRCCKADTRFWHDLVAKLTERGYDAKQPVTLTELTALGNELVTSLTGGDTEAREELDQLLRQYLYAVQHRRQKVPLEAPLERLLKFIAEHATRDQLKSVAERVPAILEKLPLKPDEIDEIVSSLCFSGVKDTVEREVRRMSEDEEWLELMQKFRKDGGQDTDKARTKTKTTGTDKDKGKGKDKDTGKGKKRS